MKRVNEGDGENNARWEGKVKANMQEGKEGDEGRV